MAYRHLFIKGSQAGRHGGGGVAMHQQQVVALALQDAAQAQQNMAGDVGQVLPRLHDVEVVVGLDAKQIKHLVKHLPMLRCDANLRLNAGRVCQSVDDRRHFDGLGAGTKNSEDLHG